MTCSARRRCRPRTLPLPKTGSATPPDLSPTNRKKAGVSRHRLFSLEPKRHTETSAVLLGVAQHAFHQPQIGTLAAERRALRHALAEAGDGDRRLFGGKTAGGRLCGGVRVWAYVQDRGGAGGRSTGAPAGGRRPRAPGRWERRRQARATANRPRAAAAAAPFRMWPRDRRWSRRCIRRRRRRTIADHVVERFLHVFGAVVAPHRDHVVAAEFHAVDAAKTAAARRKR